MSKDIIAARVQREQEWCWAAWMAGYPTPVIRSMAMRPPDEGGLGYALSVSAIKGLIAAHRASQGDIVGTREERIERRQMRYDQVALDAQAAMARAREYGNIDEKAAKVLLDVSEAEARMHGDNAAMRIDAQVTTHDGTLDDLNAALVALGREPVEVSDAQ